MELMEDGNLMDKVHILIQRDFEYYKNNQSILQETMCPGVVGGKLDFPRSASFAAVKLVHWWEDEFIAAYRKQSGFLQEKSEEIESMEASAAGCGGVVKASDPKKFIGLVTKSSDHMLEHLHILTQEALDHADLSVLTGTIGAAALLKNCLWCYIQRANENHNDFSSEDLQKCQKKYQEMVEALAERLLDLHCRLLSLYILQDADSLDWENSKPFCESERGSYIIQMWWLYMQGVREDLWNSVPPQMAQRVFAGMFNESLTILAVRYGQAIPSKSRTQLYAVDISNLLLCITELLPSICNDADEFTGVYFPSHSKLLRDVHSKCQELLTCLITRGCHLEILHKVFKKSLNQIGILKPRISGSPSPWLTVTLPYLHPNVEFSSMVIELLVLLAQPQPNWASLLKILAMDDCKVCKLILQCATTRLSLDREPKSCLNVATKAKCEGFLCSADGSCKGVDTKGQFLTSKHYYDLIYAVTYFVLTMGDEKEYQDIIVNTITQDSDWLKCFDRRQVWNLKKPPWYQAIASLTQPLLKPIRDIAINAVKTGASIYQSSAIILISFAQLWDTMSPTLSLIAGQIQDILPTNVVPLGNSVLLQILIGCLYAELMSDANVSFAETQSDELFDGTSSSPSEIALAIAESLCSIDEDNKHTEEIQQLVDGAKSSCLEFDSRNGCKRVYGSSRNLEYLVSLLLINSDGKKSLKILHHFIKNNDVWLLNMIQGGQFSPDFNFLIQKKSTDLMQTMFFIGDKPFDELLSGNWKLNWHQIFHCPMGLSLERVSNLIFSRWDLKDAQNAQILMDLQTTMKQQ